MVRLLSLSLLVLALAPLPVNAERSALAPFELKAANGHWECQCVCWADVDGVYALADMDGKCDGTEVGQDCKFTSDDGNEHSGVLGHCGSVFVID